MNPFDRIARRVAQRIARKRVPADRPLRVTPPGEDGGDAAAGGVTARLPKVPPRLSPGNAAEIPRDDDLADVVASRTSD